MATITSDVYDILTPVPLKELSAIVISREIWRCEVMKYRSSDEISDDEWFAIDIGEEISLETMLPDLPFVIFDVIRKYVTEFGYSLSRWLGSHHETVFNFHYNHENHILKHFLDFICNSRGSIHYARTAERMMHCDQFNLQQKFTIACTYFFEDDIRRLWPLVSGNMNLDGINFSKNPQLYYWICCLRNELDKIPLSETNNTVDEVMLNAFMPYNGPSLEYFWSRIPSENRKRNAVELFLNGGRDMHSFIRVILPKLNEQELEEIINERSYDLMHDLLGVSDCKYSYVWYDEECILATWMQICHIVNESAFTNLVRKILHAEYKEHHYDEEEYLWEWCHVCCKLWNDAPEKLKRAAVREIISNNTLFAGVVHHRHSLRIKPNEFVFLTTFLSHASSQERRTIWYEHWRNLIDEAGCENFKKIMNLCLENEDEIVVFAKNVLTKDEDFRNVCDYHMWRENFAELDDFLSIAWPENFSRNKWIKWIRSIPKPSIFSVLNMMLLLLNIFLGFIIYI